MSLWIIQYRYDNRDELRARLLDEHQWYLAGLADAGAMIAHGTFGDHGEPGALLIASAPSADHVEDLLASDPFVVAGAVEDVTIRVWDGHIAPSWKSQSDAAPSHERRSPAT